MGQDSKTPITRFYVIRTGAGHYMLKVEGRDIESFLELLGDMIDGCGDSHEEAMEDFASKRLPGRKEGLGDQENENPRPGAGPARRRWWVR